MFKKEPRNISYLASISFHLILALIFLFLKMSGNENPQEYLLVGFGSGSGTGSPGSQFQKSVVDEKKTPEEKTIKKKEELKKVELPKAKQKDDNNLLTSDKKKEKEDVKNPKVKPLVSGETKKEGNDLGGEGEGGFGFELDFGGKGMRRIYSYNLPEYPEGVSKEIDVKLRFTILPDGTVSKIFPLLKADAKLELAAINSLKNWRFEPLPQNAKQIDQTVVIIFPYRLQ